MSYAAAATGGMFPPGITIPPPTIHGINHHNKCRSKRNIVLNEMKNKCSFSNNTAGTAAMAAAALKKPSTPPIVERLMACLENDDIRDLELIGRDGVRVPALRCVIASASPVLERMLYGDFSEATRSAIEMGDDCSGKALEALVEFCCTDQLTVDRRWGQSTSSSTLELIEDLLSVARLGHTYAIYGLQDAAQDFILSRLQDDPSLACLVFEGAHPVSTPDLYVAALDTIRSMPYVALKPPTTPPTTTTTTTSTTTTISTSTNNNNNRDEGDHDDDNNDNDESQEEEDNNDEDEEEEDIGCGGIACLSPQKLEEILQDGDIEAEELFLFQLLVEWKNYNEENYEDIEEICQRVVRHFRLACIDPQDLKDTVMTAGFVSQDQILEAFMDQALAATREGMSFAAFRAPRGPEGGHVLVQGAGFQGCNGIYTQRKDVSDPPLLYFVKPDKKKNVTYYLIKDRTESWKICLNATALYEWKVYNNYPGTTGSRKLHDDFPLPQTGWSLPSATGGLPSAKVKLPVPTCKFFRPRDDNSHVPNLAPQKSP